MTSRHVLVLSGGLSPERDVSLRSGRRVADALRDVRPDWHVAEADVDNLVVWAHAAAACGERIRARGAALADASRRQSKCMGF